MSTDKILLEDASGFIQLEDSLFDILLEVDQCEFFANVTLSDTDVVVFGDITAAEVIVAMALEDEAVVATALLDTDVVVFNDLDDSDVVLDMEICN
jgi:hypothetical protein